MPVTSLALGLHWRRRMTFRIQRSGTLVFFDGLLDQLALAALRAHLGGGTRVVLRKGTEVEPGCEDGLRTLEAEVVAESAFLSRWLRDGQR